MDITGETLDVLLGALGEQLGALGSRVEMVVIGGSALTALGLIRRATRDVGVLAIADKGELHRADPLPDALLSARAAVARDFGLDENWLNAGPTDLIKWGAAERLHDQDCYPPLRSRLGRPFRRARRSDPLQDLRHG